MNTIYWPDGEKREEPTDGFTMLIGDSSFRYNAMTKQWTRIPLFESSNSTHTNNTTNHSINFDSADSLILEMKSYLKCECGAESVDSNVHSDYCPKYEP